MENSNDLTPQEVADILKIAKTTVYEMIKRKELNSYRVGNKIRIESFEVEEYKRKKLGKTISEPEKKQPAPTSEFTDSSNFQGFVICGQDILLDILSRYIETHKNGSRVFRSYIGSYNGLYAMYIKGASIATAHLWDSETNSYNIPYIKRLLPGVPVVVVHLAKRMQGFYVKKGNPKNVKASLEELTNENLSVVLGNEQSGSVGLATKKILEKYNLYEKAIMNTTFLAADSRSLNNAIKENKADLILNWHATTFWDGNNEFVDPIILPDEYSNKSKLVFNLLKTSKNPELAKKFMDFAASEKGKEVFKEFGFLDENDLKEFDKVTF